MSEDRPIATEDDFAEDDLGADLRAKAYQAAPKPSVDHLKQADAAPTFNPTGAPEEEVYASGRTSRSPLLNLHSEHTSDPSPVEIWRIEERERVASGLGLIASRIALHGTLGDLEGFKPNQHLSSRHEQRVADPDKASPIVSFSTDPESLAKHTMLSHGFGIKEGRDSVVVRAHVAPDRVFTGGQNKEAEVHLIGGVAPHEYRGAYEVQDFVSAMVPPETSIRVRSTGEELPRDAALQHWRQSSPPTKAV